MWSKEKPAKETEDIPRRQEENQVKKSIHGSELGKKILINRVNDCYLKQKERKRKVLTKKKEEEEKKKVVEFENDEIVHRYL